MPKPRKLMLIFLGIVFSLIFLWKAGSGSQATLLAEDGQETAYLPLILAPPEPPVETPTATATTPQTVVPTEMPTDSATTTETPIATTTETVMPTATETAIPTVTATVTATATETVTATETATATATATDTAVPTGSATPMETLIPPPSQITLFLPVIAGPPVPDLDVPAPVFMEPPIDFELERQKALASGLDLAFNKIGFHILQGNNRQGLSEYIQSLDAAGVPVVLKGASDAQYLYEAQELGKISGVEHVLVYRDAAKVGDPDYNLDPETAAQLNWQANRAVFPPELDPTIVWMETINEPREKPAEWPVWLARFSLEQAKLAVAEGVRYAAFSWTSGAPPGTAGDPAADWESPEMLEFLRYAAEHPDQVAIAVHEYSFTNEDAGVGYPYLVGRFQYLFKAADAHGIARPTVFITEWGWEYDDAPSVEKAMEDITWAAWLYAAYPQVKGAAIWTLGKGEQFGSIGDTVRTYLEPLADYSLSNYFLYSPGTRPIDIDALAPAGSTGPPTGTATPTPTITPTPDPDAPLRNGSFEEGWETIQFGNQRPNFWQISWVQPGDPLYDSPDMATGVCECVHKLITQLPPEEQPGGSDPLILDGEVTYKMFSASVAFGTQLKQSAGGLTPGEEYRLTVPLRLHYDKATETDPYAAETGVWVDDLGDWANLDDMGYRKWCKHEVTFTAPDDGQVDVTVRVKSKYPSYKDFFMDDVRLTLASEPPVHSELPLCDPTPELERYQPYKQVSWFEQWIAGLSDSLAGITDIVKR